MLAIIFCMCVLVAFMFIVDIRHSYSFTRLAVVGILCFGCVFITSCSKDSRRIHYTIYLSGKNVKVLDYQDFVVVKCHRYRDGYYTMVDENGNKTKRAIHETFTISRRSFNLEAGDTLTFDIIPGYKLDNCRVKGCDSIEYSRGQVKLTLDKESSRNIYITLFLN